MLNLSSPPELPFASGPAASGERVAESGAARVGQVLKGKWTLDAVLGSGGTATVYAATHRNGNRVAVKVLHRYFSAMPAERERFAREGYLANKVEHPDVVRVLDEDIDEDGNAFLVMELLDGEPLVARWKAAGYRLPGPEALWIADRLLTVLEAAHAVGIVHRDIKPENLFLTAAGGLKVLDFGIARIRGGGSGTIRGIVLGTPGFTAPEQARGEGDVVGPRTDIWAVGATLFALMTGRLVHEDDNTATHLLRVSMEPAPPVRQIEPSVPESVARVIDCALSFSPQLRFSSAAEMRQSIAAAYRLTTGQNLAVTRPAGTVASAACAPTLRVTTGTTVVTRRSGSGVRGTRIDRWDAAAMATAFFALGGIVVGLFASRARPATDSAEGTTLVAPTPTASVTAIASASAPATQPAATAEPASSEIASAPLAAALEAPAPEALHPPPVAPPPRPPQPPATRLPPPARTEVRANVSPVRTLARPEGAPAVPLQVLAVPPSPPPSALPESPPKRPARSGSAGDNFDFVETRR